MTSEPDIRVENREELLFLLTEAAELEHSILCTYLFAAFSMKTDDDEWDDRDLADLVRRWQRVIYDVAVQEMVHFTLVCNLLTAVGGAPHLRRPNFPQRSTYYPEAFQMTLRPFSEETLHHFIFLERPEGMEFDDTVDHPLAGFMETPAEDDIVATPEDFETVGHLYRGVEAGLAHLVEKLGEDRVFIGPPQAQATRDHFSFPELIPVTDLASAIQAVETIVEEGEGARGDLENSHYGRFMAVHEELTEALSLDPSFSPARPTVHNPFGHHPFDSTGYTMLDDPHTIAVSDLFNAVYELMLMVLARYFAHTEETDDELRALGDVGVDLMFVGIKPIGEALTRLPAGPSHPGRTAGPSFQLDRHLHVLPHKEAAWAIFRERTEEIAKFAERHAGHESIGEVLVGVAEGMRGLLPKLGG